MRKLIGHVCYFYPTPQPPPRINGEGSLGCASSYLDIRYGNLSGPKNLG